MTTTTTDTLTRWTALWQQDEGLRPQSLHWDGPGEDDHGGIYPASWMLRNRQTKPYVAAALIRDSAVRWLVIAWANSKIEYEVMCEAITSNFPDDALYAACKAVLGEDKT